MRRPRIISRTQRAFPFVSRDTPVISYNSQIVACGIHSRGRSGALVKCNARIETQNVLLADVMFPGSCRVSGLDWMSWYTNRARLSFLPLFFILVTPVSRTDLNRLIFHECKTTSKKFRAQGTDSHDPRNQTLSTFLQREFHTQTLK